MSREPSDSGDFSDPEDNEMTRHEKAFEDYVEKGEMKADVLLDEEMEKNYLTLRQAAHIAYGEKG